MRDLSRESYDKDGGKGKRRRPSLFETHEWLKPFIPSALILSVSLALTFRAPEDSIFQYLALAVVLVTGVVTTGAAVKGFQDHGFTIAGCLMTLLMLIVGAGILIVATVVF